MINPYLCYSFSFIVAIVVYLFGWSKLYPTLSVATFCFLSITIVLNLALGWYVNKNKPIAFKRITFSKRHIPYVITIFIYILWTLDFLYEGGIPLVKILLNQSYNYRLFGIPSLHVFIVTFSSFFTLLLFQAYLSTKRNELLLLYLVNLIAAILIYSRAMLFFNLSGSFFLFLFAVKKIPVWFKYSLPVGLLFLFYFFGALGTLRSSREAKTKFDNALFMNVGGASETFKKSVIPKEYFWTYIYISSPLANLQENINSYPYYPVSVKKILEMINNEILMDFISKRINGYFKVNREPEHTIIGPFNVSTVYSRSFSYLGWIGMIIMLGVVLIIPWLYIKVLPADSPFFHTGFAILCTIFLFLAYDNMIRFTGLSFQLVYPITLHFISRKFPMTEKVLGFS